MPRSPRPIPVAQERLETLGPRALTDQELLAAILGPTSGANPVGKAAEALLASAPMSELAWASPEQLSTVPGIGRARAAAIAAAFEVGRRAGWAPPKRGERVLDPRRVYELLRPIAHAEVEEFWIVLLDVRGRLIKHVRIAQGQLSSCPVHPRDVLCEAVRARAHSLVLAHSHPSSDPTPSPDDYALTERLRAAAELVGVMCRDHIVLGGNSYFSFVEAGKWHR